MIDWSKVRPSEFIEPRFYVEISFRKSGVVEDGDMLPVATLEEILSLYDSNVCYDAQVSCSSDGYPTVTLWCDLADEAENACISTLIYLKERGYEPV